MAIVLVEILPLHFGALHPLEQVLIFALAFGPFAILAGVIWWRKRTEDAVEDDLAGGGSAEDGSDYSA